MTTTEGRFISARNGVIARGPNQGKRLWHRSLSQYFAMCSHAKGGVLGGGVGQLTSDEVPAGDVLCPKCERLTNA